MGGAVKALALVLCAACSGSPAPPDLGDDASLAPEAAALPQALPSPEASPVETDGCASPPCVNVPCDACAYHTICQTWDGLNQAFYGCNVGGRCQAVELATHCPAGCVPSTKGSCQ